MNGEAESRIAELEAKICHLRLDLNGANSDLQDARQREARVRVRLHQICRAGNVYTPQGVANSVLQVLEQESVDA